MESCRLDLCTRHDSLRTRADFHRFMNPRLGETHRSLWARHGGWAGLEHVIDEVHQVHDVDHQRLFRAAVDITLLKARRLWTAFEHEVHEQSEIHDVDHVGAIVVDVSTDGAARLTSVANAILVLVGLIGVVRVGAVVLIAANAVSVDVIAGIVWAGVTDVADTIFAGVARRLRRVP